MGSRSADHLEQLMRLLGILMQVYVRIRSRRALREAYQLH